MNTIIISGIIKIIILNCASLIASKIIEIKSGNKIQKMQYAYKKKENNKLLNLLFMGIYFVPYLGTITLAIDLLIYSITVACCIANKNFLSDLNIKKSNSFDMPAERLEKLQKGNEEYKNIIDSLKIEGLNEKEIKEFISDAKKEDPYINNNETLINECSQRKTNIELLEEIKDYLINSFGAYKYTLNKKIESIDIDGDTATIGVSKFDPKNPETTNNKIYTKKFKLK